MPARSSTALPERRFMWIRIQITDSKNNSSDLIRWFSSDNKVEIDGYGFNIKATI